MTPATILVVDDHQIVFNGIKLIIQNSREPYLLEHCYNGDEAYSLIKDTHYDLIILDVNLPDTDTLQWVHLILLLKPKQKILIFSMSSIEMYAKRFLKQGVYGYLSKQTSSEEFLKAVKQVLQGDKYISKEVASILSEDLIYGRKENVFSKLSDREMEIMAYLLKGMGGTSISKRTNLHTSTIGTHKNRIFEKLGVSNVIELKELAQLYGFLK